MAMSCPLEFKKRDCIGMITEFYALLVPEVFCLNKVRLGVVNDGGKWVCNLKYVPEGCKIYSLDPLTRVI
uniref:Uncharacterized protein n=1 Tax=Ditylenchus dipsaci TaxID=166011 RepID=A0A915DM00_9BILA